MITDPSYRPQELHSGGPGMYRDQNFHNYSVSLDWRITKRLNVNFSHNYQHTDLLSPVITGTSPMLYWAHQPRVHFLITAAGIGYLIGQRPSGFWTMLALLAVAALAIPWSGVQAGERVRLGTPLLAAAAMVVLGRCPTVLLIFGWRGLGVGLGWGDRPSTAFATGLLGCRADRVTRASFISLRNTIATSGNNNRTTDSDVTIAVDAIIGVEEVVVRSLPSLLQRHE